MAKTETKKVQIKLVGSLIGASPAQRKALGLRKMNQVVEHAPSATIMGMVNKVSHLVKVVE